MKLIIDSHVHIFPLELEEYLPRAGSILRGLRETLQRWSNPLSQTIHRLQPQIRYLPPVLRLGIEQLGGAATIPLLLTESTPRDLEQILCDQEVSYALTIAHPPFATNDFILESCEQNKKLIPVVNVPKSSKDPAAELESLYRRGARVLKIHPAADGEGPNSGRYRSLIEKASERSLPVIVHTGEIQNRLFYKNPAYGPAEKFTAWFKVFKNTKFILAHMNFNHPNRAMDLMEEFPNLYTDTSWQPPEVISEAVRRLGSDRIMLGSDWPLGGSNIQISIQRIQESIDSHGLRNKDALQILGLNAARLFMKETPTCKEGSPLAD